MKRHFIQIIVAIALACAPQLAWAATLSLSPSSVSVAAGDTFTERVLVSSADQAANAVSGEISYPTDLLSVVSISKTNSVLTLWVEDPTFSNTAGTVDFSGVVPNPGFIGGGTVFLVQFSAKKAGAGNISFSSAAVLANDGNGTNILTGTGSADVTVAEAPPQTPVSNSTPARAPKSPTSTQATSTPASVSTTTPAILSVGASDWFTPTSILLLILILLLVTWFWYAVRWGMVGLAPRSRRHAHLLVHQQFGGLRDAVTSEIMKFEHARTKREFTKEEEVFMQKMEKMLDKAEEVIEKEIDKTSN